MPFWENIISGDEKEQNKVNEDLDKSIIDYIDKMASKRKKKNSQTPVDDNFMNKTRRWFYYLIETYNHLCSVYNDNINYVRLFYL